MKNSKIAIETDSMREESSSSKDEDTERKEEFSSPPPPPPYPYPPLSSPGLSTSVRNLSAGDDLGMLDQCSFCTRELHESDCLLGEFHLPCGHTLCSECMKDSLNELGMKLESIDRIIAIDTAVNDHDGFEKVFYQCPVCQTSLILVPKHEHNNHHLTLTHSPALRSQSPDLHPISTCEEHQSSKLETSFANDPSCSPSTAMKTVEATPICSVHGEAIKWYCSTCQKVACDECLSEGNHRNHEFKLCSSAAPSLRSNLRDLLDRVRIKRESVNSRLGVLESRGDERSYTGPQEAIARHCSELRSAVDVLESRLLRDVNFFMRDSVGVTSLRDELTDLDDFEGRCSSFESSNAVELCVLMSSLALYESNLRLSPAGRERGETKEIDLERGEAITASVNDNLGLKLEITPKLLEVIRDSGTVHIMRRSSAYQNRCRRLFAETCCGNLQSFEELKAMSKKEHVVCLGYLCLSYTGIPIRRERNPSAAKQLARRLFPLLLSKCDRGGEMQYLYLNKDELFILGSLYSRGMGCPKNPDKAFKCFQLSALDGLSSSICCLGLCYASGIGVTQDREAAFKLYRQSADLGDAAGQFNLASCFSNGLGASPDYSKAIWFYYLSANQGYPPSVTLFHLFAAYLGLFLLVVLWITLLTLFLA